MTPEVGTVGTRKNCRQLILSCDFIVPPPHGSNVNVKLAKPFSPLSPAKGDCGDHQVFPPVQSQTPKLLCSAVSGRNKGNMVYCQVKKNKIKQNQTASGNEKQERYFQRRKGQEQQMD